MQSKKLKIINMEKLTKEDKAIILVALKKLSDKNEQIQKDASDIGAKSIENEAVNYLEKINAVTLKILSDDK